MPRPSSNSTIPGYRPSANTGKPNLIKSFNAQSKTLFKHKARGYEHVVFLGIYWEDEDLPCSKEVFLLASFFETVFRARSKIFAIPKVNSQGSLNAMMSKFVMENQGDGRLLIVYYGGHGTSSNGLALWAAWGTSRHPHRNSPPTVDWFRTQPILMSPNDSGDVLIIIDACHSSAAAGARGSVSNRKVELIAAATLNSSTPGPGHHSFTIHLIRTMKELMISEGRFSVSTLNRHLQLREASLVATPHYSDLSANDLPSIMLCPADVGAVSATPRGERNKKAKVYLNLVIGISQEVDEKVLIEMIAWLKKSAPGIVCECEMLDVLRRDERATAGSSERADMGEAVLDPGLYGSLGPSMDAGDLANIAIGRWAEYSGA
ncbi:hypothetical protein C7212DRAFT_344298 [Tuber magnatum]|uniref:Uncharacterized protein n=1 Tax=Tuber magnatum TaxID=42249 RepID=A0A317SQZ5_9PEZI|nr:hypothetical protein C7212DRAFT_344298 [Tuber magnatum]